jgi:acyl-CoA synthetase (AMP-forming)/AMP-acid ligase II
LLERWPATLRQVMVSGGALAAESLREILRAAPDARVMIRYGVTEATAAASILPSEWLERKQGSIGAGLPGLPLEVVGADGAPTPPGCDGEIVVRGPHIALGYLGEDEATGGFRDGAFATGDEAYRDEEGFIFVRGRRKTFLKIAGHRVEPHEIEEVIASHQLVAEVAVYGRTSLVLGEEAIALVVPTPGSVILPRELRQFCLERLPPAKTPTQFVMVAAIPKTPTGKVARSELERVHAALGGC